MQPTSPDLWHGTTILTAAWTALAALPYVDPLRIGESVEEILRADLAAEHEAVELYRNGVAECEALKDYVSRDLFAEVLRDEEKHVDYIETQFDMIRQMGIQNYVQLQSEPAED